MTPFAFPECNVKLVAPAGYDESQVQTIDGFIGPIVGGELDGQEISVVAWKPDESELEDLKNGNPIYLVVFGRSLPPHTLKTQMQFTNI